MLRRDLILGSLAAVASAVVLRTCRANAAEDLYEGQHTFLAPPVDPDPSKPIVWNETPRYFKKDVEIALPDSAGFLPPATYTMSMQASPTLHSISFSTGSKDNTVFQGGILVELSNSDMYAGPACIPRFDPDSNVLHFPLGNDSGGRRPVLIFIREASRALPDGSGAMDWAPQIMQKLLGTLNEAFGQLFPNGRKQSFLAREEVAAFAADCKRPYQNPYKLPGRSHAVTGPKIQG